jgi:hypothetical protein
MPTRPPEAPTQAPNPLVRELGFWLIFPYLIDLGADDFDGFQLKFAALGERLASGETLPPAGGAGQARGSRGSRESSDISLRQHLPGALSARGELDRWFIREVSSLLRAAEQRPEERGRQKFLFASFEVGGEPLERGYRLALLRAPRGRDDLPKGAVLAEVFEPMELEVFAVLSQAGAVMLFVHARLRDGAAGGQRPTLTLHESMELTYYASLCQIYTTNTFLALVPVATIERATAARPEQAERAGPAAEGADALPHAPHASARQEIVLAPEELEGCMHLHPSPGDIDLADKGGYGPVRLGITQLPRSLPDVLRGRLLAELGGHPTYIATKGKIPVASLYVIDQATLPPGTTPAELASVEGLAARCLRHPRSSAILPLPLAALEAEEFQVYRVSGSQTLYVSCEGLCAFGTNATAFDERFWPQRVGSEYLLTFVIALHQALICQDISWKSYTDSNRRKLGGERGGRGASARSTEALLARFHEFNTDYNFSVVSHQYNVQRLYRCARVALGVERTISGIQAELMAWLEAASREEQQALNSLAVFSILFSCTALFASCNLNEFNKDARLSLVQALTGVPPRADDADKPVSAMGWFLLPTAIVALFMLHMARRGSLGRHVRRVRRLFLGA